MPTAVKNKKEEEEEGSAMFYYVTVFWPHETACQNKSLGFNLKEYKH